MLLLLLQEEAEAQLGIQNSAELQKPNRIGSVGFLKNQQNQSKTGAKFKSFEILKIIGKPDQILVYRPLLQINRSDFYEIL
jgi:hypothetical protein